MQNRNHKGRGLLECLLARQKGVAAPQSKDPEPLPAIQVGTAHHIGARPSQQDRFGVTEAAGGLLAVVADGMGGLTGGDRVSQCIVTELLRLGAQLDRLEDCLPALVEQVNDRVNGMLGPQGLYKSGSTLVSVAATNAWFQWISVGDSRIYLFRSGSLRQLNREHNLFQEWRLSPGTPGYEEALRNPEGRKLTSFVGMGKLRYVSAGTERIPLQPGDRVLLLSDGVFNTLSQQAMEQLLTNHPQVQQAANAFLKSILETNAPGQDNFTVVILGV